MSHLASGKSHSFLGAGRSCPAFYGGFKNIRCQEQSLRKVDKACLPPAFFFTSLYGIPSLRVWTGSFWNAQSQDLPSAVVRSACLGQITKFIYGHFRGRLEGRLELVDLPCESEVLSRGMPQGTGPQPSTTYDI